MTIKTSHTTSILAVNDMHGGVTDNPAVKTAKLRFGIIGNAPALAEAVARAIRVAPIDLSVLVTGESGSGKEFFPKIIHQNSPRKHAKYIAVNCGAIPEGTIDSELFGHEKGAFTGAVASRKGYFEEADGGTIFLDEVAELPMTTQARLLRVLKPVSTSKSDPRWFKAPIYASWPPPMSTCKGHSRRTFSRRPLLPSIHGANMCAALAPSRR